jgi:ParB/RepB/Spo0J family partition protein
MSSATTTKEPPVHIEGQKEFEPGLGELERPLGYLPIEQIKLGNNPRKSVTEAALAALTESAQRLGFLQTVLVRRLGEESYELLAGGRRYKAAKRAGRAKLPAMVIEADEEVDEPTRLAMAFAENALHEELTPLEEAMVLAGLLSGFGFSLSGAADHLGMSLAVAEGRMSLLDLPDGVRDRLARKEINLRNAATLVPIAAKSPGVAEALAERVASGAQSQNALANDPAAALRRLADEERQPDGTFLIPFGPHDTVNLDEVAERIRAAATQRLVPEASMSDVEAALVDAADSLSSVPADLRTALVSEIDVDRARAFEVLIEYREGAYRRSGVLVDPVFAADWARGVAATLAASGGEAAGASEGIEMPEEGEDPKASRERRRAEAFEAKSSNAHLDHELISRFEYQTEVSLGQARVLAVMMLDYIGRDLAVGHRVVREAWLKRDFRPSRGGPKTVEEYPSIDEILGLLEADLRKATSGPALIGRLFSACATAILGDQRVLGAAARPNLELPYTLGREDELYGLAPEAFWQEIEACLGEEWAAELRPHFSMSEGETEAGRDRLAHSGDGSAEALELIPDVAGEEESGDEDEESAGAGGV